MKKIILFAGLCIPLLPIAAHGQNSKVVTAAQANGVYRFYDNEFREGEFHEHA